MFNSCVSLNVASWPFSDVLRFLVGSVALGLGLYIFLSCRRRRKQAIYNVEAGQIHGPSLGETFDPRTATLSASYPKTPRVVRVVSPGGTPRSSHFATAQQERLASDIVKGWPKPPMTAPVTQSNAYYPFPGYSPVSNTLRHLMSKNGHADAVVIVSRRHLCNSHTLHFQASSLGHCIQDNPYKKKFIGNGSDSEPLPLGEGL